MAPWSWEVQHALERVPDPAMDVEKKGEEHGWGVVEVR